MSMLSEPITILKKIHQKGFLWLYKRINYEVKNPTFSITKRIVKWLNSARKIFKPQKKSCQSNLFSPETLVVVHDLSSEPPTYDFAHFLATADSYGVVNGKSKLFVIFVDREIEPLLVDKDYEAVVPEESQKWRFDNIVLQLVRLYPNCIGYCLVPHDADLSYYLNGQLVFPADYSSTYKPSLDHAEMFKYLNLNKFVGFKASEQGLNYIKTWRKKNNVVGRMVVITLRQYGYDKPRNSNIAEWAKFANWIKEFGYTPIFVPDTDACWEPNVLLENFIVFKEPCWNLGLRIALYELAFVNLFYYNGPAAICALNKNTRSIIFFPVLEDSVNANLKMINNFGLTHGQRRYDFAKPDQFLSWKRDRFENIQEEFLEFIDGADNLKYK